ncbi:rhomboid family intramembrane serine protease [Anaerobacillus sp. CMMVII]|uniref:rhomboid family intramembrane serine protease n=1 Tax=Anaerobacillus sp. CMMVII TaxID=2755588 RepID=UPI0021B75045|nr:rhomboid family intramembrane serine protease [Anaerobacillus sp. CMMVII]MCT8139734.1 rhomboid family intramembrane serine protease [Anaerobacillus sp. CMMVII]
MDELSQDVYYWQVIHHLVKNIGMSAFLVKSEEKEIWLETTEDSSEGTTVIRILRHDMNWSNYIARDLENLAKDAEHVRKDLRSKRLHIINVYISSFLPVDSYERFLDHPVKTKNNRITIQSFILDGEHGYEQRVSKLSEVINCELPRLTQISHDPVGDIHQYRREVVAISDRKSKQERALFTYGKPVLTFLLLISVLIIFGFMEYYGSSTSLLTLVEFGAKYDPLIHQGEWWRFFTAVFLHIGIIHLVMNSIALYYLGGLVERIYGTPRFLLIYLIAGLFGSISSFAFNSQVSAGASGAIFGCFGAILFFGMIHRKLFFRTMGKNVIIILIINLSLGFLIPMIDNSAHIGGLVGGFLAASCIHLPRNKQWKLQMTSLLVMLGTVSGLLLFGFSTQEDTQQTHLINIQISQELLQRGEIEKAYPLLKAAVDSEVDIVEAHFLLAYSEAKLGYLIDAERNLLITIEQRPLLHEAHFNLSLVYYELRQYREAYLAVEKALELEPNMEEYIELKTTIEKVLEKQM